MHQEMFIPKTLTIGFQTRSDTFTGKLAYVIYTDHKGKLRKEGSWNSWRDKTIEPITLTNDPTSGFTFNKGVKRDGYWGNGRSVIRVWDPRDFEFEISIDNLIGILMHSDVSKRDITEPCVFAWYGTELILLPTNSDEYKESVKFTDNQSKKFSSKELVVGYTYQPRNERETVVYMGRLDQYEVNHEYSNNATKYVAKSKGKNHAFISTDTKRIFFKSPSSFIAHVVAEEVHADYASLVDTFYTSTETQPVVDVTLTPKRFIIDTDSPYYRADIAIRISPTQYLTLNDNSWYYYRNAVPHFLPGYLYTWDSVTKTLTTANVFFRKDADDRNRYRYGSPYIHEPIPVDIEHQLLDINTKIAREVPAPTTDPDAPTEWQRKQPIYDKAAVIDVVQRLISTLDTGSVDFVLADGKTVKIR
jgi:hypothetical protein